MFILEGIIDISAVTTNSLKGGSRYKNLLASLAEP